jgi:hypothetical protein
MITLDQAWDYLIENGLATFEELQLVTCINGYNLETLQDVLDVRTGYKNFAQIMDEDSDEDSDE